jgi:lactoylglutathione lyase
MALIHSCYRITAADLDATLARLAEQGIGPDKPPYRVREGGSRLCFVKDPDGCCPSVN